ncbi:MAG: hypothetical protein ACTHZ7_08770 [Sphingobacterium sp.]
MANQFIIKDTMSDMRDMVTKDFESLEGAEPEYAGVLLLGYYKKEDTPAPIIYNLSETIEDDDGGSIIDIDGFKLEHDFISSTDLSYWGAIADGNTDTSEILQKASKYSRITVQKGVYKFGDTVSLSNAIAIVAEPGTKFLGTCRDEQGGATMVTMFKGVEHVQYIKFENIDFDFDRRGRNYVQGSEVGMNPGITFTNCEDISFVNCKLSRFVTNLRQGTKKKARAIGFTMVSFDSCKNISFDSCYIELVKEECLTFYRCSNIRINGLVGVGTGGVSTWINAWYCDGVSITNCQLDRQAGSVINCHSRNVIINNIQNNYGLGKRGRGIDLSNESQADKEEAEDDKEKIPFGDLQNIIVSNCYINAFSYGIMTGISSTHADGTYHNLKIDNNYIDLEKATGASVTFLRGIQITNPKSVLIQNNTIILGDSDSAATGDCIRMATKDDIFGSVVLRNNSGKGLKFFNYITPNSTIEKLSFERLEFDRNTFYGQNYNSDLSVTSGAFSFIYFRDNANSSGSPIFKNIIISNNIAENLNGGYFYARMDNCIPEWTNLVISNNVFTGSDDRYMEVSLSVGKVDEGCHINNIRLNNNRIKKHRVNTINGFRTVVIEDNILDYGTSDLTVNAIHVRDVGVLISCKSNVFISHSSSTNQVTLSNINVKPKIAIAENNAATNVNGAVFFRTTIDNTEIVK